MYPPIEVKDSDPVSVETATRSIENSDPVSVETIEDYQGECLGILRFDEMFWADL